MDLKNGYKVIYEKIADGIRTFYATKNAKCDPDVDDKILEAEIGKYKLIYEKDGCIYCSESGIPAESDSCFNSFEEVFAENNEAVNTPSYAPIAPEQPTHAEAIATNGDSHGELHIDNNVVTLKSTGTIEPATNTNGNTYHHVGFKITAPEGIDPASVVITRPDGKTKVMSKILDGANFTNVYWKLTEDDRVFTYYIDWNNDGVNDLTVVIDASEAILAPAEETVE